MSRALLRGALALGAAGAAAALVSGVLAGLVRLAIEVPCTGCFGPLDHGALMVSGFAGTVIGLERAVASRRSLALLGPLASALGAALLLLRLDQVAALAFLGAGMALLAMLYRFWRQQPALPLLVGGAGAASWVVASLRALEGASPAEVVPWWIGFLALTIAGERLELVRFRRQPRGLLVAALGVLALGLAATVVDLEGGSRLVGIALAVLAGWLWLADTARLSVTRGGLARYTGVALLASYTSLALAGGLFATQDALLGPLWYDAALHAFFVGFVMGAIFAHGPIMIPALTGLALRLNPAAPLGLALLHGSLALRIVGDATEAFTLRQTGASLHVLALVVFAASMAIGLLAARTVGPRSRSRPLEGSRAPRR